MVIEGDDYTIVLPRPPLKNPTKIPRSLISALFTELVITWPRINYIWSSTPSDGKGLYRRIRFWWVVLLWVFVQLAQIKLLIVFRGKENLQRRQELDYVLDVYQLRRTWDPDADKHNMPPREEHRLRGHKHGRSVAERAKEGSYVFETQSDEEYKVGLG